MTLLVILLPAPARADAPPPADPTPLAWLTSPDGLVVAQRGQGPPAEMPAADSVVAVAPAEAVAWHSLSCPKAPANRMRAALGGLLEEQLLSDDEEVHLALAPRPVAGNPVWVAALHKPWLQGHLDALAAGGRMVDRLVPALAPALGAAGTPEGAASAHFSHADPGIETDDPELLRMAWTNPEGAACLPLAGGLLRSLLPGWAQPGVRWSATPAAAVAAERWLGQPVTVRNDADVALAAVRSPWNLLQFDLAARHRSSLAAGRLLRQMASPGFTAARWGLAALVAVQVLGLNLSAWQLERQLAAQRSAQDALLRSTHPQVRAVLDAPVQMQRETAALRSAAGVPGDDDFETLLAAAAAAWPEGQPPAAQLRFEPGRLSLPAAGWAPPQVDGLRQRLGALGWSLNQAEGRLVIAKAAATNR